MSENNISSGISCISLIVLGAACGSNTVDLGGDRLASEVQRGASCSASPITAGSIHAKSQQDLEDLTGCEEINGDLQVDIFAGADLSPLSSLRVIDGQLELGHVPDTRYLPDGTIDPAQFVGYQTTADVVKNGYLSSLTGLESLERASSLVFDSITADNLEPLLGLRQLDIDRSVLNQVGSVTIRSATNLRDLHGLSNIGDIRNLVLAGNTALSSLGGISLGPMEGGGILLIDSPLLTSIDEVAPGLSSASTLVLTNVGLSDLSSLSDGLLTSLGDVVISLNANLLDLDDLANFGATSLVVYQNPLLQHIRPLSTMSSLQSLEIVDNPQLETIDIDLPARQRGPTPLNVDKVPDPIKYVDIENNAQLTRVSLTQGLEDALVLNVASNESLVSFDLGTLTHLQELDIDSNPNLTSIAFYALQTVEKLSVVHNPNLDTSVFGSLKTFEATLQDNR